MGHWTKLRNILLVSCSEMVPSTNKKLSTLCNMTSKWWPISSHRRKILGLMISYSLSVFSLWRLAVLTSTSYYKWSITPSCLLTSRVNSSQNWTTTETSWKSWNTLLIIIANSNFQLSCSFSPGAKPPSASAWNGSASYSFSAPSPSNMSLVISFA